MRAAAQTGDMVNYSDLDPIEEARARVRLRYARARPVRPGPPSFGVLANRLSRKALPKRAPSLARLQVNWEQIVGAQLARLCFPDKIGAARGGRRLTLRVVPAAAGLVQHQSEMIRQRVSVAAGGDITEIRLVQRALTGSTLKTGPRRLGPALSPDARSALLQDCAGIENDRLRDALLRLGEAVHRDDTDTPDQGR
jgi:hypothetical protein